MLLLQDIHEAEYVCNYILNGGNKEEFLAKFKNAMSKGFDPDKDLVKVRFLIRHRCGSTSIERILSLLYVEARVGKLCL